MEETQPDFAAWYSAQHRRVRGSMLVLCGDADLASEVTDEAFARALARWSRVSRMASPGGWTYKVALNLLRRRLRRRENEQHALSQLVPANPTVHEHAEVWAAVAVLPTRQRTAVVLRYVADLPEAEIAAAMGVSRGTVASTLSDARRALAGLLAPVDDSHEEVRR